MTDQAMYFRHADTALMPREGVLGLSWALRLFDFAVIFSGFVGGVFIYQNAFGAEVLRYAAAGTLFAGIFFISSNHRELYQAEALTDVPRQISGLAISWGIAWSFLAFTGFALKASADMSRVVTFSLAVAELPVLIGGRIAVRALFKSRQLARSKIALLCIGDMSSTAGSLAKNYDLVHQRFITAELDAQQLAHSIRTFLADLQGSDTGAILVATSLPSLSLLHRVEQAFRLSPLPVVLLTEDWVMRSFSRPVSLADSHIGFQLQAPPLTVVQKAIKHGIDVLLAGGAIFLLSPIMLLIALAVKLDSRGPVIFRQRRQGFNGKEFHIFKFRSMTVLENGAKIEQVRKWDKRVTHVGRFLRSTSLDELPQLFNVLRGEMSLVGPRPHAIAHDDYYEELIRDYALRRHMRPGLSGWAQVNGHRGETPKISDMEARVECDLWYINNWSPVLDIWILLRTVGALFLNKNVY